LLIYSTKSKITTILYQFVTTSLSNTRLTTTSKQIKNAKSLKMNNSTLVSTVDFHQSKQRSYKQEAGYCENSMARVKLEIFRSPGTLVRSVNRHLRKTRTTERATRASSSPLLPVPTASFHHGEAAHRSVCFKPSSSGHSCRRCLL
jgi:hypothetical protein